MKKLLLDTSIYGEMIVDADLDVLLVWFSSKRDILPYGFTVVKKELKDVPESTPFLERETQRLVRWLYAFFTRGRTLVVRRDKVQELAQEYCRVYEQLGGLFPLSHVENEFLIVACGSITNMDIVTSDDNVPMVSETTARVYEKVNAKRGLRVPRFFDYDDFRGMVFK